MFGLNIIILSSILDCFSSVGDKLNPIRSNETEIFFAQYNDTISCIKLNNTAQV